MLSDHDATMMWRDHQDFVRCVSWDPTDHTLFSCAWDGQLLKHLLGGWSNKLINYLFWLFDFAICVCVTLIVTVDGSIGDVSASSSMSCDQTNKQTSIDMFANNDNDIVVWSFFFLWKTIIILRKNNWHYL